MPRGKEQYDDDDWDDGYDDDDYDEDEDDYDEYEEAGRLQAKSQKGGKQQPQPAKQPQAKQPQAKQSAQQKSQQKQPGGKAGSKSPATTPSKAENPPTDAPVSGGSAAKGGSAATGGGAGGTWRCAACTFDNPPLFLACDVCSAAKPAQQGTHTEGPRGRERHQAHQSPLRPQPHTRSSTESERESDPTKGISLNQVHLPQVPPLGLNSRSSLPQVSPLGASLAAPAPRCRRKQGHGRVSRGSAEAGRGACVLLQQSSEGQKPLGVLPLARVPWVLKAAGEMRIEPFDFSTLSPDDAIQSALKGGHVAPRAVATSAAVPASSAATAAVKNANSSSRASSSASPAADVAAGVGKMQIAEGSKKEASPSASRAGTTVTTATAATAAAVGGEGGGEGKGGEGKGGEDEEARRRRALEAYEAEGWIKEGMEGGDGKPTLHLIVLGHVDAGKSTIMGHLLHKLGRVSNKEMHRVQRDAANQGKGSFAFAWVLDESSEERARGVTMSVAMSRFETPKLNVVLLDAPGHRDLVPSMIAGTAQADAALLVIDATPGAFEAGMGGGQGGEDVGQSKEHAQIARSLGVEQLCVVVNKMDATGFEQGEFERIKGVLGPFLTRQCGFRDGAVRWVPLSGLQGENLDSAPTDDRLKNWYTGPTLLEAVDSFSPPPRALNRPLRLAIAEVLRTRGLGQAGVAGKLECGAMRAGTKVLVMPGAAVATVKALERDESPVAAAWAGESVDVGLQGVEANQLLPGGVLCHPDYPIPVATRVEARLLTLDLKIPLLRGTNAILHAHAAKEACRVVALTAILDAKTGAVARAKPRAVGSNQSAVVELSLDRGVCLEAYPDFRAFGRITLREGGRTLAVGIVLRILAT
ncbi:unnamed protein product [Closterium sp. NIES-64]|nr:unnamed protein product [Closterium sp. NIES-64]